jgi:hypothetical protein
MFIFEKKNQKTSPGCFARKPTAVAQRAKRRETFFASFFKKAAPSYFCLTLPCSLLQRIDPKDRPHSRHHPASSRRG